MVRQARAIATRNRLIEGAARAFERLGYAEASLGDITEEAGVTKGALYFHFRSKEELGVAIVEAQHATVRDAAAELLAEPRPVVEQMLRLADDLARRLQTDPVVRAGIRLTTDSTAFEQPVQEPYLDWMTTFRELAERGIAERELTADVDPAELAGFIIPAYTGVQLVSETFTGRSDLRERLLVMWRIVLAAVVPESGRDAALELAREIFTAE